jgi:hypothetical protein
VGTCSNNEAVSSRVHGPVLNFRTLLQAAQKINALQLMHAEQCSVSFLFSPTRRNNFRFNKTALFWDVTPCNMVNGYYRAVRATWADLQAQNGALKMEANVPGRHDTF